VKKATSVIRILSRLLMGSKYSHGSISDEIRGYFLQMGRRVSKKEAFEAARQLAFEEVFLPINLSYEPQRTTLPLPRREGKYKFFVEHDSPEV